MVVGISMALNDKFFWLKAFSIKYFDPLHRASSNAKAESQDHLAFSSSLSSLLVLSPLFALKAAKHLGISGYSISATIFASLQLSASRIVYSVRIGKGKSR